MMIKQLIANATADKKLAQAARKNGNYEQAVMLIERAVKTLEAEKPRLATIEKDAVSSENRDLAEALAEVYGSSGGIYRSAKQYPKSVKAYDDGAVIEQDERFGFVNSYNLTQRLVARVLVDPKGWTRPEQVIEGERFADLLSAATDTVASQTRGPRAGDVWAWADLGILRILSGDTEGADTAWDTLADLPRQPFVFDSTLSVIFDLLERIGPLVSESPADQRLMEAVHSLENAETTLRLAKG